MDPAIASERLVSCTPRNCAWPAPARPRPHLDDKVLTSWNGLMISALAQAAALPCGGGLGTGGRDDYLAAANRAAAFVVRELCDPARGVLYRSWRRIRADLAEGFAEDYAYFIQGLLDLYEAGYDACAGSKLADGLQSRMDDLFWDEAGGYFNSAAEARRTSSSTAPRKTTTARSPRRIPSPS